LPKPKYNTLFQHTDTADKFDETYKKQKYVEAYNHTNAMAHEDAQKYHYTFIFTWRVKMPKKQILLVIGAE